MCVVIRREGARSLFTRQSRCPFGQAREKEELEQELRGCQAVETTQQQRSSPKLDRALAAQLLPPPALSLQLSTFLGKASKVANAGLIFLTTRQRHIYRHHQLWQISNSVKALFNSSRPALRTAEDKTTDDISTGFRRTYFIRRQRRSTTTKTPRTSYNSDT